MKKVGILTFHGSHNYGSMLQAFALQQILKKLGYESKIINFRTEKQKNIYSFDRKKKTFKDFTKHILLLSHRKALKIKYDKFEDFLHNYLDCTKEYSFLEELEQKNFKFDCFIVGSDQIWNTNCFDFDKAYFLPFVKNCKKIAYAPSLGPIKNNYDAILEYIKDFDYISVREKQNFYSIEQKLGKDIFVALDPTLLLTKEEWFQYIKKEPLIKQEYIFMYSPSYKKYLIDVADKYSKDLNLPVVVSNLFSVRLVFKKYIKYFEAGPLEFLNLIKNARIIISGSFHATLFSMLFNKEVISPNGDKDFRIVTLIEKFKNLQKERNDSLSFLKEALK